MLPGIFVALVTPAALVISCRIQNTYVVLLIWLVIIVLAGVFGPVRWRM
jgi:hypothetical protein